MNYFEMRRRIQFAIQHWTVMAQWERIEVVVLVLSCTFFILFAVKYLILWGN